MFIYNSCHTLHVIASIITTFDTSRYEDKICINPHHYQLYVAAAKSFDIVFATEKIDCKSQCVRFDAIFN